MAHRKQILVRSQKSPKEVKVDMAFILNDESKEKVISQPIYSCLSFQNTKNTWNVLVNKI